MTQKKELNKLFAPMIKAYPMNTEIVSYQRMVHKKRDDINAFNERRFKDKYIPFPSLSVVKADLDTLCVCMDSEKAECIVAEFRVNNLILQNRYVSEILSISLEYRKVEMEVTVIPTFEDRILAIESMMSEYKVLADRVMNSPQYYGEMAVIFLKMWVKMNRHLKDNILKAVNVERYAEIEGILYEDDKSSIKANDKEISTK